MNAKQGRYIVWLLLAATMFACIQPQAEDTVLPTLAVLSSVTLTATLPALPIMPTTLPTNVPAVVDLTSPVSGLTSGVTSHADPAGTPPVHIVQRGENLYRIAQAYSVSTEALAAANGLTDPNRIFVGQTLLVPVGGVILPSPTPAPASPTAAPAATGVLVATPLYPTALPLAATSLNGIPFSQIIVLPPEVIANVRMIYATGQALGRDPRAFSKLGDSTIENPHFLARFDEPGGYKLGDYAYLQGVVDYFHGSFSRQGVAIRRGLHSWSVLDSMWADKTVCRPNEHMVACELRLHNPCLLFIKLGSNDVGVPNSFDQNMRAIVEFALANGVIPVLGTKADRHEGAGNINNDIIRQIAADYHVPLWDFDRVAQTLPRSGLDQDGVHLTSFYAHDYTSPLAFQRGYGVHNLTALLMLDALWRDAMDGG